ncbi:glycosyltransferase family 4 protein [Caldicellulosiruptor morganii]|uniref:Glycosyltransferase family 4 protein n=1 Tax=Caldicellulosiruptor morganii TaxID=1387555 RepID=A0ABY7BN89_9FIRM|nr:glycosyltransferase family 1 protein [Caldicellulosiruptor morganii]WAM32991.1 glycosyltransferase family 4 protein [Caldicellulosiruptor morganii]
MESSCYASDKQNEYLIIWPDKSEIEFVSAENININLLPQQLDKFWEEIMIKEIIIQNDIDIYHVPQNGIGIPLSKKCSYIITLHDIIPFRLPETVGPGYLKIFTKYVPKILKIVDSVITVSEFSKKDICEFFDYNPSKVFVTHSAPEDIYKPLDKQEVESTLKQRFGIDFPYILYVGGFSPRKNLTRLIKAYNMIKDKIDSIHLVIPGKLSRSFDEVRNLVIELGLSEYVHFLSYVEVEFMPYLYNGATLFVYPSLYKGFGLPPLEAMACKVPTIASNTTSMPEVLKDAALLVDPYSTLDIAEKILFVLQNDNFRKDLSEKGYKLAKNYSWEKTISLTLTIYQQIFALKS